MLQIHTGQALRNQPLHLVTFACEIPLRIMQIVYTGTSALTEFLQSTPHGGGPYAQYDALQEIK